MKPDMTAAEHLQQCAACNHGRTPCQKYVKAWPVKPNSVCKCKIISPRQVEDGECLICGKPYEPVAEPAEPSTSPRQQMDTISDFGAYPMSAEPQHVNNQTLDTRVVDRLESALKDAKSPAPPLREFICRVTGTDGKYFCPWNRGCSDPSHPQYDNTIEGIKAAMKRSQGFETRGTPKLEEIARQIANSVIGPLLHEANGGKKISLNFLDEVAIETEAILRPFITPACSSPDEKFQRHTGAVQDFMNELYAIMVDPLAEGTIKVADMCKAIKESAFASREFEREHMDICGKLAECAKRHGLGLGGERYDDLVIAELDKLATPASTGEAGLLEAWRWLQNQIAGILAGKSARNFDETMAAMDRAVRRVSTGEANGLWPKCNFCGTELEKHKSGAGICPKCGAMKFNPPVPTSVPQAEPPK